jgi:hypothetical protein
MMERSCTDVQPEYRRSLQKAESRNVRRQYDGEIMHGRESSYREVATIIGNIVDPGLLHRRQSRFRVTNKAKEFTVTIERASPFFLTRRGTRRGQEGSHPLGVSLA